MYDTIIIGAGMSGLAAGIRLAHFDQRVCILERHSAIGGLNSFYRRSGRDLDVGLHAMTNYRAQGIAIAVPWLACCVSSDLAWEELALAPQVGSEIMFPGIKRAVQQQFRIVRVGSVYAISPGRKTISAA